MEPNSRFHTNADHLQRLLNLSHKVIEAFGIEPVGTHEQSDEPFEAIAECLYAAVDRGEVFHIPQLSAALEFALVVRRAQIVDDPTTLRELVDMAERLAERVRNPRAPEAEAEASGEYRRRC